MSSIKEYIDKQNKGKKQVDKRTHEEKLREAEIRGAYMGAKLAAYEKHRYNGRRRKFPDFGIESIVKIGKYPPTKYGYPRTNSGGVKKNNWDILDEKRKNEHRKHLVESWNPKVIRSTAIN